VSSPQIARDRRRQNRRATGRRRSDRVRGPALRWSDLHGPVSWLIYLLIGLVVIMVYKQLDFVLSRVFAVVLLFVFAAILALLLNPVVDRIERWQPIEGRRGLAVLIAYGGLFLLLAGIVALLIPSTVSQGTEISKQVPGMVHRAQSAAASLQSWLNQHGLDLRLGIPGSLAAVGSNAFGSAVGILTSTLTVLINMTLITIIAVYLSLQGRQLLAAMRNIFPDHTHLFDFAVVTAGSTLAAYLRGQVLVAFVMSVPTGVLLSLIGVRFALVIAVVTFFVELIPMVGAGIAIALAIGFGFLQGPVVGSLAMASTFAIHFFGAYIIGLRVLGRAARLHPLVALATMLIGAELGGVLGAVFAIPVAGIVNVYLGAIYRARRGEEAFYLAEGRDTSLEALPRFGQEITQAGALDDFGDEELADEPRLDREPAAEPRPRSRRRQAKPAG